MRYFACQSPPHPTPPPSVCTHPACACGVCCMCHAFKLQILTPGGSHIRSHISSACKAGATHGVSHEMGHPSSDVLYGCSTQSSRAMDAQAPQAPVTKLHLRPSGRYSAPTEPLALACTLHGLLFTCKRAEVCEPFCKADTQIEQVRLGSHQRDHEASLIVHIIFSNLPML